MRKNKKQRSASSRKMTHKQKVRLARSFLSEKERRENCPIFQSEKWMTRRISNFYRELKRKHEAFLKRFDKKTKKLLNSLKEKINN